MSTINFSHLKLLAVFACVVEPESFAGAARKLNSSRSRVSEQISVLEGDLGVRLIQRSTRQLKITPEGRAIYQRARSLPDILQSIEAIATPSKPSGRVTITMNHDIAHRYMLPRLKPFLARYPDIELDLILDDSALDLIGEQIDIGIRIGFPKDDTLIARPLHQDRFQLFASPGYLEQQFGRQTKPTTIKDLKAAHWIVLRQRSFSDVIYMELNSVPMEIKPNRFFRCNSPMMMQKMVQQGLGIAQLLPSTIQEEINAGTLIQVMPELQSQPINFALVYPSRKQIPTRIRVLIDYLLDTEW